MVMPSSGFISAPRWSLGSLAAGVLAQLSDLAQAPATLLNLGANAAKGNAPPAGAFDARVPCCLDKNPQRGGLNREQNNESNRAFLISFCRDARLCR